MTKFLLKTGSLFIFLATIMSSCSDKGVKLPADKEEPVYGWGKEYVTITAPDGSQEYTINVEESDAGKPELVTKAIITLSPDRPIDGVPERFADLYINVVGGENNTDNIFVINAPNEENQRLAEEWAKEKPEPLEIEFRGGLNTPMEQAKYEENLKKANMISFYVGRLYTK